MHREVLREMDIAGMSVFDRMGKYWVEIADKNQTKRQIHFLRNQLDPEGYILDLACGTGRHTIALNKMGFKMVGIDISIGLLRVAKEKQSEIQLIRGDIRFLPFKSSVFAGVISMDTSFGYLLTENDDRKVLMEIRKMVKDNSVFIIDVFNREQIIKKYSVEKTNCYNYPSFLLSQKRRVSTNGERLYDLWIVYDGYSGKKVIFKHTVRLYKLSQLMILLKYCGFKVEKVFGDYEMQEYNAETSRLIIKAYTRS